ncbi:MAG: hypothetical protein ACI3W7_09480 [Oscillospiraceae bacterium]
MKKTIKILSLLLIAALCLGGGTAFADAGTTVTAIDGGWTYTYVKHDDGSVSDVTITSAPDSTKQAAAIIVPGYLGGHPVDSFGGGGSKVMSNNTTRSSYVLFPEELKKLADTSVYDFNYTDGWVIPGYDTWCEQPFSSCDGSVYAFAGSKGNTLADKYGMPFVDIEENACKWTVSAGEGGAVNPGGTYYIPAAMQSAQYTASVSVTADEGYKIVSVTVDGETTVFDGFTQTYRLNYSFAGMPTDGTAGITAEFTPLASGEVETRTFIDYGASERDGVTILDGAVAEGWAVPDSWYDAVTYSGLDSDYKISMDTSTGLFYYFEGKLYQEVFSSRSRGDVFCTSKADAVNVLFSDYDLVYGRDYQLLRVYNGGGYGFCVFAYALVDDDSSDGSAIDGITVYTGSDYYELADTNTAGLFAQGAGDNFTVSDVTVWGFARGSGPSEAANFYGIGSQVHVDGGVNTRITKSDILTDTVDFTINNCHILGGTNAIYATAQGILRIDGGEIFSCSSLGHGPYCSLGGQILMNVGGTNIIGAEGVINTDRETLEAGARPDARLAGIERNDDVASYHQGVFQDHDDDVTLVVTAADAGTALATDTGGGVIVANNTLTKTYGLRSAGVYSIGAQESWVYLYNSNCTSFQDAALCSAASGYIYAFNCELQGVMGLKARSSGTSSLEDAGIHVYNSRIAAVYDEEDMAEAYDFAEPREFFDYYADLAGTTEVEDVLTYVTNNISMETKVLNMFADPANRPSVTSQCLSWWFVDRSLTPGFSGGNKLTCIYVTGAQAPIEVDSTKLVNDNYTLYGPESAWWAEHAGQTDELSGVDYAPAENLLISVENGSVTGSDGPGSANVYFYHENSMTKWDITGESDETCELTGDFFLGQAEGSEVNSLNVRFVDSEWTGRVTFGDEERSGVANLSLDGDSTWIVTGSTKLDALSLAQGATVAAPEGYTISVTVNGQVTELTAGEYQGEILLTVAAADGSNTDPTYGVNVSANGAGAASGGSGEMGGASGVMGGGSGEARSTVTVTEEHTRSGKFSDDEYDEFEEYIASATAGMPSDVPGYAELMTASLDDYDSLDAAKAAIDSRKNPGMGGGSGEASGGVTGTGGNGSFVAGVLDWSKTNSFPVSTTY